MSPTLLISRLLKREQAISSPSPLIIFFSFLQASAFDFCHSLLPPPLCVHAKQYCFLFFSSGAPFRTGLHLRCRALVLRSLPAGPPGERTQRIRPRIPYPMAEKGAAIDDEHGSRHFFSPFPLFFHVLGPSTSFRWILRTRMVTLAGPHSDSQQQCANRAKKTHGETAHAPLAATLRRHFPVVIASLSRRSLLAFYLSSPSSPTAVKCVLTSYVNTSPDNAYVVSVAPCVRWCRNARCLSISATKPSPPLPLLPPVPAIPTARFSFVFRVRLLLSPSTASPPANRNLRFLRSELIQATKDTHSHTHTPCPPRHFRLHHGAR